MPTQETLREFFERRLNLDVPGRENALYIVRCEINKLLLGEVFSPGIFVSFHLIGPRGAGKHYFADGLAHALFEQELPSLYPSGVVDNLPNRIHVDLEEIAGTYSQTETLQQRISEGLKHCRSVSRWAYVIIEFSDQVPLSHTTLAIIRRWIARHPRSELAQPELPIIVALVQHTETGPPNQWLQVDEIATLLRDGDRGQASQFVSRCAAVSAYATDEYYASEPCNTIPIWITERNVETTAILTLVNCRRYAFSRCRRATECFVVTTLGLDHLVDYLHRVCYLGNSFHSVIQEIHLELNHLIDRFLFELNSIASNSSDESTRLLLQKEHGGYTIRAFNNGDCSMNEEHFTMDEEIAEIAKGAAIKIGNDRLKVPDSEELSAKFNYRIFGQERLIKQFVHHFTAQRKTLGHGEKARPIFCLLIGPPGLGKTYFAKVAAELIFGSRDSMVPLNFTQLPTEPVELKRSLLGIEPRYGGASAGLLTGPLESNPRQVVLLDEIHLGGGKLVFEILTSLSDGCLGDNYTGKKVGVRETIFLAATNMLFDEVVQAERQFLSTLQPNVRVEKELQSRRNFILDFLIQKGQMRPEAKDRITAVFVFQNLSPPEAAKMLIHLLQTYAKERGMRLVKTDSLNAIIEALILQNAAPPKTGEGGLEMSARSVVNFIDDNVLNSLNELKQQLPHRSGEQPLVPVELTWDGYEAVAKFFDSIEESDNQ